jgi:S1-C subfamily serine protease
MDRVEPAGPATEPPARPPSPRRRAWVWLVALGALAAVAVVVMVDRRSSGSDGLSAGAVDSTVRAAVDKRLEEARAAPPDSALVYEAILPSLVLIKADRDGGGSNDGGVGTGVVVNAQGAIITARHVVANARSIAITFADGTKAAGEVVTEEPETDIAVLAADQSPDVIVPAVLGSTGGLRVGDAAFAVGHPLGLVGSLSAGVISGLDRSAPTADGTTLNGLIQFDAAVNPGSSGGPLLNRNGQVIGIITALANPSRQGFFIGIGFAVPIGTAAGGAGGPEQ